MLLKDFQERLTTDQLANAFMVMESKAKARSYILMLEGEKRDKWLEL